MSGNETPTLPRDNEPKPPGERAVRVRCPHCGNHIQLVQPDLQEVVCGSCGSSFHVDPDATNPMATDRMPERIGRFVVQSRLGRGAFGTVYKARDPELERVVAVKVPRAGYFATAVEEARFLREAKAAAKLQHPGIVSVYEVADGDPPAIVSQFIDGVTLADRLTASRPSFRESAELIATLADALDYAHRNGVIHRDVKPSNVLMDESGKPHLADFGLARRDEAEITVTVDGQILGTPAYMSPEQAAGKAEIDGRTDVYSLGVMLYELLADELPFRGNTRMLIHQVLNDDPKPPRKLNDHIPRDLETVCLKCLSKEPAKRYTAGELAADLRRWLTGQPVLARPVSGLERGWRWAKRNKAVAGLLTTAAALLVVALGVSLGFALFYRDATARTEGLLRQAERREGELAIENGATRADAGDRSGLLRMARGLELLHRGGASDEQQWFARMNLSLWGQRYARPEVGVEWGWPKGEAVSHNEFVPVGNHATVLCLERVAKTPPVWVRRDVGDGSAIRRYVPPPFAAEGKPIPTAAIEYYTPAKVLDGGKAFASLRSWAGQNGGAYRRWQLVVWDVGSGAITFSLSRTDTPPPTVFWGRSGRRVCILTDGPNRLEMWDAVAGRRTAELPLETDDKPNVWAGGFSPNEQWVWTPGPKGPVMRDAATGRVAWDIPSQPSLWADFTFAPDGREFVTFEKVGQHPAVKLVVSRREVATGKSVAPAGELPLGDITDHVFISGDGRSLVVENQQVKQLWAFRSWAWPSLKASERPDVHPDWVTPDRKLAVSHGGRLVSLTDASVADVSFGTNVRVAGFSADGRVVVVQDQGRGDHLRCRDIRTGLPLGPMLDADILGPSQERGRRFLGVFGPSLVPPPDRSVVLLSRQNLANQTAGLSRVDFAPVEGTPERVRVWAEVVTGMELDETGTTHPLNETELADRKRRLADLGGSPLPKP